MGISYKDADATALHVEPSSRQRLSTDSFSAFLHVSLHKHVNNDNHLLLPQSLLDN